MFGFDGRNGNEVHTFVASESGWRVVRPGVYENFMAFVSQASGQLFNVAFDAAVVSWHTFLSDEINPHNT